MANEASPLTTSVSPYPRPRRLEMLDVWRGICCLMLVVFHAAMQATSAEFWQADKPVTDVGSALLWLASRAWIGVPIFFVISGYCIMATLSSRANRGGVTEFAKRRFRRIYPPYWAALAFSSLTIIGLEAVWPGLLTGGTFTIQHPLRLPTDAWLGNLTLTESWRHVVWGGGSKHILPNTWTLAYEEQFYVVAGLILFLLPRRILLAFSVFTVVAMGGKVFSKLTGIEVSGSIFDGQWLLIANGLLLYYRIHFAKGWRLHAIHAFLALGILAHLRDPSRLLEAMPNHDIDRFVAFSFTLATSLTLQWETGLARLSALRPFQRIGAMSYSIYLSHAIVVKAIAHGAYMCGWTSPLATTLVVVPVSLAVSIVVGWGFYLLVERHYIPGKAPTRGKSSSPAASVPAQVSSPA
ncbi:MAG: acyltransferase [Planctomycetales bacterium]|nr:acyltransferase [Planctomycetales bacterium]